MRETNIRFLELEPAHQNSKKKKTRAWQVFPTSQKKKANKAMVPPGQDTNKDALNMDACNLSLSVAGPRS